MIIISLLKNSCTIICSKKNPAKAGRFFFKRGERGIRTPGPITVNSFSRGGPHSTANKKNPTPKKILPKQDVFFQARRKRDSNPRTYYSQQFSRLPQSTALPFLRDKSKINSFLSNAKCSYFLHLIIFFRHSSFVR